MLHKSVLFGYSLSIPSNMDRPLSGTPLLNSRMAACEMNFICLCLGRLKRARFTRGWTPSCFFFNSIWIRLSQTYISKKNVNLRDFLKVTYSSWCWIAHTLQECLNFFTILSISSSANFCCSGLSVLSYIPSKARCTFLGSQYCNALWNIFATAS